MPDPSAKLSHVEIRDLYQAALGPVLASVLWVPPAPEVLAPFFPGFEIESLIARGGMGAVYRARQVSLNRTVAIKLLPFELGADEDFADRFRREAAALARLNHPNIVTVYDFGQADDGHYFIVMEFIEGTDLAERLRSTGPVPPQELVPLMRQVCSALAFAHAQGVVHRDIKPANILIDAAGQVKVSDFGIAQLTHEEMTRTITLTNAVLGTPAYTAPEQLIPTATVDPRADIFSLGVTLYELLTGQLPRGVFRPVSDMVRGARGLDGVLVRAMQSDPGRRQQSILELGTDLERSGRGPLRSNLVWLSVSALALLGAGMLWAWPWAREPFVSSLGLTFVPAGTQGVLFCTTETRVRDMEAYVRAGGQILEEAIYTNHDGTQTGWIPKDANWRRPTYDQDPDHPVVAVTQKDAVAFCEWLTRHERESGRIGSADRYRLPTDAEWSRAAGLSADAHDPAGLFPWRGPYPPPPEAGNFAGEEVRGDAAYAGLAIITGRRDPYRFTAPVASFHANAFGLHDLGGNVVEWLEIESPGASAATIRGSSWWDASAASLDAGHRRSLSRDVRSFNVGFRIVLERATPGS